METCSIQLTHPKAHDLLKDLEAMDIIKIIKPESQRVPNSKRFRSKLLDKTAEALQEHVAEGREKWVI